MTTRHIPTIASAHRGCDSSSTSAHTGNDSAAHIEPKDTFFEHSTAMANTAIVSSPARQSMHNAIAAPAETPLPPLKPCSSG